MKSKRLTISCVAMIALAGTPQALQEVNKLLAIVQYKAQVKFWSMVSQPGEREAGRTETLAATRPLKASSTEVASNCPLPPRAESWTNRKLSSPKANRRASLAFYQPSASAPRTSAATTLDVGLIARRAPEAPRENDSAERLLHARSVWESQPSRIVEVRPASPPLPGSASSSLPHPPTSKGDTFRFVTIPMINPVVVSALTEKQAIVQFKLMKKSLEDNKLIRQKVRFPPVSRGAAAFPSS
jgi:hypothetical protein